VREFRPQSLFFGDGDFDYNTVEHFLMVRFAACVLTGLLQWQAMAAPLGVQMPLLTVGIATSDRTLFEDELIAATEEYLLDTTSGPIRLRHLTQEQMAPALERKELDFLIAPAAQCSIAERSSAAKVLVSQALKRHESSAYAYAGTLITADPNISRMTDLADREITVTENSEFLPYLLSNTYRHMLSTGHMPKFRRRHQPEISEVLDGSVSVLGLRSCLLERYPGFEQLLRAGRLRVISKQPGPESFCRVSTKLVPGLAVLYFPHTDMVRAKRLQVALLAMPKTLSCYWSTAQSLEPVTNVLLEEKAERFMSLRPMGFMDYVARYKYFFAAGLLFLLLLVYHGVMLQWLVRRRTTELEQTMTEKLDVERKNREIQEQVYRMERTGVVGQISAMVAHELKQPLTAIASYADGLSRMRLRGKCTEELLEEGLSAIQTADSKAIEIINRVRSYAKDEHASEEFSFAEVVEKDLMSFRQTTPQASIEWENSARHTRILGSHLECRIILSNLLKNALQACAKEPLRIKARLANVRDREGEIEDPAGRYLLFEMTDNGPMLSDQSKRALSVPMLSSKPEGLGLGISIVRRLVQNHGGLIFFEPQPVGGLRVRIVLPTTEEQREGN